MSNQFAIPKIIPDFERAVAFGKVTGASVVTIMGHNEDVDTATVPEDVWQGGGLYPFQSAAVSLEIVSDDAGDDIVGTGARTVRIETLDSSYLTVIQTVDMDGTTPVALTGTHLRVNRVQVVTSGSSETNEGIITLRVPGPGATLAVIDNNGAVIGDGISHNGIYTVPAGFKFQFMFTAINILKSTTADAALVQLRLRPFGESFRVVNQWSPAAQGTGNIVSDSPSTPIQTEKTDIRFTVVSATANNLAISCFVAGLLIPNSFF